MAVVQVQKVQGGVASVGPPSQHEDKIEAARVEFLRRRREREAR